MYPKFPQQLGKKQFKPPQPMIGSFRGTPDETNAFNELIKQNTFIFANTFIEQVGFLCENLRTETMQVKYRQIGDVFGISRQKARKLHMKFKRGVGRDGRPPCLTQEEFNILEKEIKRMHSLSIYPTINQITKFIYTTFNKYIYVDTIRHMISIKFSDMFKSCVGIALEDKRFKVSIQDIENNLNTLQKEIQDVPIDFIFDLDEMGTSEYEDSRQQIVIVPASYQYKTAPYSITRAEKHSTCLACINPSGIVCRPQYAVQRTSYDSELLNYLNPDEVQIVHTESGYVNAESFTYWIYTCFLPELHKLRNKYSYAGKAVLIMDNCSSHITSIKNINLLEENLVIHLLVPHSSHLTQPLDLNVFGSTKQFMSNYRYIDNLSRQSNQIIKIHCSLRQATTQYHCRAAFRSIGITTKIIFENNYIKILATYNFNLITRIKEYSIPHILNLIETNSQLTPIQSYIYSNYVRNQNSNNSLNRSYRITLPSFGKIEGQNHIPMPLIFTKKSNS